MGDNTAEYITNIGLSLFPSYTPCLSVLFISLMRIFHGTIFVMLDGIQQCFSYIEVLSFIGGVKRGILRKPATHGK